VSDVARRRDGRYRPPPALPVPVPVRAGEVSTQKSRTTQNPYSGRSRPDPPARPKRRTGWRRAVTKHAPALAILRMLRTLGRAWRGGQAARDHSSQKPQNPRNRRAATPGRAGREGAAPSPAPPRPALPPRREGFRARDPAWLDRSRARHWLESHRRRAGSPVPITDRPLQRTGWWARSGRACDWCGRRYVPRHSDSRTCRQACRQAAYRARLAAAEA